MQKCKLCQKDEELQNSHIIPRFLYKFMQKTTDNQIAQFDGLKNLWQISNRQLKAKLFCRGCEQLLGKNETEFSKIFHNINEQEPAQRQPYGNLNNLVLELKNDSFLREKYTQEEIIYTANQILKSSPFYNKNNVVKYFAISYIFRELLRNNYKIPDYYIDRLRNYLLNIEYFDFMIDIRLHNSPCSFNLFTTVIVMDGLEDWKHFAFYLPNMLFHIAFSIKDEIPNEFIEPMIFPDNLFCDEARILKIVADLQKGAYKTKNFQPFCIQNSNQS